MLLVVCWVLAPVSCLLSVAAWLLAAICRCWLFSETLIIANGFSCRTQIEQATDRQAVHLAEVLERAYAAL